MGGHTLTRHPGLVSGSILPPTLFQRRQAEPDGQVMPIGVLALDQIDLPLASPILELFLPCDRGGHVAKHLISNEPVDFVSRSEALDGALTVLPKPFDQVACDTDVERPVGFAGKDIDARVPLNGHGSERYAKWTLKQVQGDEIGKASRLKPRHAELVSVSICQLDAERTG